MAALNPTLNAFFKTTSRKGSLLALVLALVAVLALSLGAVDACAAGKNAGGKNSREIWLERAKHSDFVRGKASWYGGRFHTAQTASGVPYDMYTFTAAHRTLPFGTIVRVTDQYNGKSVMVCVTDRGPYVKGRIIDMSLVAADRIGLKDKGVSSVNLEVVGDASGKPLNDSQAFFVEVAGANGQDRFGPYETFADATALQQALLVAHPEANVILDDRARTIPSEFKVTPEPEATPDPEAAQEAQVDRTDNGTIR